MSVGLLSGEIFPNLLNRYGLNILILRLNEIETYQFSSVDIFSGNIIPQNFNEAWT